MNTVLSDTGDKYTTTANPRRGYHSYTRVVVFDKGTKPEFIKGFIEGVKAKDTMFMWFGHSVVQNLDGSIAAHINHGYDSSD